MKAPGEDRVAGQGAHRRAQPPVERPGETAGSGRPLSAKTVQHLQRVAGNRAAARLLGAKKPGPGGVPVQRLAPAPAEAGARAGAESDPKFAALKSEIAGKQKVMKAHPAPGSEASAAQGAAKPPQDDKLAQGKAANAEKMNAAKPGEFDKAAFVRAVNEAIAAQAPKNLDEADKFGDSGKAAAVKGQVQGQVTAGKKVSAGPVESTTNAPPDTSAAKDKPVTPLKPDAPPPVPGTPDAANAVPDKAPASATDFSDGPKQVDAQMADAQVTEEQLAKSNEPEFTGALKEKKEGEAHAETAPGQVRAAEAKTLAAAKGQAAAAGSSAMTGLAADRKQAGAQVAAGKEGAKGKDEAQRAQVTAKLQKVFDATKKDVEDILSGLDKKVDEKFTAGEKVARDAFTAEHKRRMDEYKDKRYSGFWGKGRWLKDKFAGLPEEANQIFVTARQGYVNGMQKVISDVADVIGAELTRAKQRIATGRTELQAAVNSLAPELRAIGKEAAGEFAGKFDELTESVDAKGKELVNTLASKYNEALKSVDAEIEAEKEKNKGLVAKAMDAVKGVIDTILKLKDMLMGVLAKAASAVMAIIKDPIGFLGKLVHAVGAGLHAFLANIAEHLKKGLIGWLTGAMAGAGLQLPAKFDLRGIIMMIGSLLGLTWAAIRGRIVQRGVPERAMGAVEAGVPVVAKLRSEGVGGIWETIKEKVGDLKANLFGKITEYLIPTVLIAGITWIISLLNPASAFIKACKMIIDIVTFIVERGAQIIAFVNSVLDAIIAIAGGGSGGVPALIETALATSIPVLIGALAAILGIGGVADKVKKFFQSLSKPVMKAVDWVVDKIVKLGKKLWTKLKGAGKKPKDKFGSRANTPEGRAKREQAAIRAAEKLLTPKATHEQVAGRMPAIERRHKVPLRLVVESKSDAGEVVHVQTTQTGSHQIAGGDDDRKKLINANLLQRGTEFAKKVLTHWWGRQLQKTRLWPDAAILNGAAQTGQAKLADDGYRQQVYTNYFLGKTTKPEKPGVWDSTVFAKGSAARNELVQTMGKQAEGELRPGVTKYANETTGADQFKNMAFDPAEDPYGEFAPLPAGSKDANADLVKAVRSQKNIIEFLKVIGTGKEVLGIDHKKFIELWNTDSNSKNWIKNEYRRADEGKHEWIPTNYIAQVLEAAARSLGDTARGAQIAEDWIILQHALRSFTSHVIWQVKLFPDTKKLGEENIQAHVGGFTKSGNPIFNGKDSVWHKALRDLFDSFVSSRPNGTPVEFLDSLLDRLESGALMWNGKLAGVGPAALNLSVDAMYKLIVVKATNVSEETVEITHETGLTLARLADIQTANYNRVVQDFTRARSQLKVK